MFPRFRVSGPGYRCLYPCPLLRGRARKFKGFVPAERDNSRRRDPWPALEPHRDVLLLSAVPRAHTDNRVPRQVDAIKNAAHSIERFPVVTMP